MSRTFSTAPFQEKSAAFSRRFFIIVLIIMSTILFFLTARLFGLLPSSFPLSEDSRFEKLIDQIFRNELSGNTLSLHFTVSDPSEFDIAEEQITLGDLSLSARKNTLSALENYHTLLKQFDLAQLSEKHQLTWNIFNDHIQNERSGAKFLLYDEPLSPSLGIQAQLPILLAEFSFRTKKDIETYMTLLSRIPDYFSSVLSYEKAKLEAGLFMSHENALAVAAQCNDFIKDPDSNYLSIIFREKINKIQNLSADEKNEFFTQHQMLLNKYVIPAYRTMGKVMTSWSEKSQNANGLYYLPRGAEYYEYLVRSNTGDYRPVAEIEESIKTQIIKDYTDMQAVLKQNPDISSVFSSEEESAVFSTSRTPEAILQKLRQKIAEDFPELPAVSCDIKYVHKSLQPYLSPAFYLTPAIDDYRNNVIYINPDNDYNDLELYSTLAHEGYPGHLFQSVYFSSTSPDLLRNLLSFGGYTEGWATYVEFYSCSLWDGPDDEATFYQKNRSFNLGLAALLDIGIHYHGYTKDYIIPYLAKLGFTTDSAEALYQTILQSPANYLKYYVGYLNFKSIYDDMCANPDNQLSLKQFHTAVLETGPAPFHILRQEVEKRMKNFSSPHAGNALRSHRDTTLKPH